MKINQNTQSKGLTFATSIEEDKRYIINLILQIIVFLGIAAVGITIFEYQNLDIPGSGIMFLIAYFPFFILIFFRKRLAVKTISRIILLNAFIVATYGLLTEAIFGAGILVLVAIVLFASYLINLKEAIIVYVLFILIIITAGYLFTSNNLEVYEQIRRGHFYVISWISILLIFIFMTVVLNLVIYRLFNRLERSMKEAKKRSEELTVTNEELQSIKHNLEEIINERTFVLRNKNDELIKSNEEFKKLNSELELFNDDFIQREFKIKKLRDKIKKLESEINSYEKPK